MNTSNSDEIGKIILEAIGFSVEKIQESKKKEADYIARRGSITILIEVKLKEDDKKLIEKRESALNKGEVFITDAQLGRNNTISGIIKSASNQPTSSSNEIAHDFRLILFIATGVNPKTKSDQFIDTLYGSISAIDTQTNPIAKKCYFYEHSEFKRRKYQIDGAFAACILGENFFIRLCINSDSPRYEKLKESEIFPKAHSFDPTEEESTGKSYILDDNFHKILQSEATKTSKKHIAEKYLKNKYKKDFLKLFNFQSPEIAIRSN